LLIKEKRRAAQTEPLFFHFYSMLETFHALHLAAELIIRAASSFGRFSWRPLSFLWTVFSDTDASSKHLVSDNRILKLAAAFNY
jgi:hypothetical protein